MDTVSDYLDHPACCKIVFGLETTKPHNPSLEANMPHKTSLETSKRSYATHSPKG